MTSRKSRKVKKYNIITFLWYFQTLFTAVEFFRISGGKKIAENTRTCALSVTSSFKNYIIFPDTFFIWNRAYVKLTDKTYCYCSRWSYSNQSFVCDMVLVNAVTWVETALTRQWWGLLIKYFGAVYQACSRRIRSFECFRHCS